MSVEGPSPERIQERYTPDTYQEAAFQFARYQEFDNPQKVIEQGLTDEMIELLEEACGDEFWTEHHSVPETELPLDNLKGELGDLLWYISQLSRVRGEALSQYISTDAWTEIDTDATTAIDSFYEYGDDITINPSEFDLKTNPITCLGILGSQLSDSLHPSSIFKGIDIEKAFTNYLLAISRIGNLRGMTLAEIATSNIEKLSKRKREPHTVGHVRGNKPSLAKQKWPLVLQEMDKYFRNQESK